MSSLPHTKRSFRMAILLAPVLGGVVGLGAFTFHYGEGLSYFSKDPRACANCHIMQSEYDSWTKGPHHGTARCVDCHLPHDFLRKYLAKADNGYRHSKGFTLLDFHEPIQSRPSRTKTARIRSPASTATTRRRWRCASPDRDS